MQQPFGYTVQLRLSRSRSWLSLGPGWAALAGALSGGLPELNGTTFLQLVSLWVLVDPVLGTLWDIFVEQGLWRRLVTAHLPPPASWGISLPYAQPNALGGRIVLQLRRYQRWWREHYWPEFGGRLITFMLGSLLALIIGIALDLKIFFLVFLALILIVLAGFSPSALSSGGGGRLQSVVQFLLPWVMGVLLWSELNLPLLMPALCFWLVYLGGLRLLGQHQRAGWLFFGGQTAAIVVLLAQGALTGAAFLTVGLMVQLLVRNSFPRAGDLLPKIQPLLVLGVLIGALSLS